MCVGFERGKPFCKNDCYKIVRAALQGAGKGAKVSYILADGK